MRAALALLAGAATALCWSMSAAAQTAQTDQQQQQQLTYAQQSFPKGVKIDPSFDLRQVVTKSTFQDDTVTYTEAVVGLSGTVNTRRVRASFNYAYSRHFDEHGDSYRKQDHSLFARADMDIIRNRLTLGGGAFAALFNRDLRGSVSYTDEQANPNLVQTYSVYLQPHYHQPLTSYAEFDFDYRIGYNGTSDKLTDATIGGTPNVGAAPGSAPNDVGFANVGNGINQQIQAKLGNREQSSRFRWDLTSTTSLEDTNRLDQQYRSYDNRFEVEYVLFRGFSLIANAGYESTKDTQRDVLRDAGGIPIIGPNGGYQSDPSGARRTVYSQSGPSYEGGLRFQPNRRTYLTFRAGKRFGRFTVNGETRYEITPRLIVSGYVTEGIDSFGRLLTQDLGGTSVRSIVNTNQVAGLGGCVFGVDPGTGRCLFDATQSITDALFRNRAVQGLVEFRHGRNQVSFATIYSERTFLDTEQLQRPGTPSVTSSGFNGGSDKTLSLNAQFNHNFASRQTTGFGLFFNTYRFALSSQRQDRYYGANMTYNVNVGRRMNAYVNGTVAKRQSDAALSGTDATASAGLRLQF